MGILSCNFEHLDLTSRFLHERSWFNLLKKNQYVFLCYSYAQMRITSGFQCFFFKDNWNECLKKLTLIMIVSRKFMRRRTDHNFPWRTKHACQLIVHNTNTEQTFALRDQINCKQGHTIDSVEFHPSTSRRNPPWLFWK